MILRKHLKRFDSFADMKKVIWSGIACCFLLAMGCQETSLSEQEQYIVQQMQQKLYIDIENGQPWGYAIEQVHFNEDGVKDYVINCDVMGHSSLAIFDGATLKEIRFDPNAPAISRPGIPIDVRLVQVLPDAPQEIMVYYGGGGSHGHYYYVSILKADQERIRRLLVETVSIFNEEKAIINHIEVADKNKDGIAEVLVYAGEIKDRLADKSYNRNTVAVDNIPKRVYCYDKERRIYQESEYAVECY